MRREWDVAARSAPQMGCSAGPSERARRRKWAIHHLSSLLSDTDTWALFSNLFLTCPPSFLTSFLPALPRQTLPPIGRWSIGHMRGFDSEVGRHTR